VAAVVVNATSAERLDTSPATAQMAALEVTAADIPEAEVSVADVALAQRATAVVDTVTCLATALKVKSATTVVRLAI